MRQAPKYPFPALFFRPARHTGLGPWIDRSDPEIRLRAAFSGSVRRIPLNPRAITLADLEQRANN
jgi:hypothetical protein